MIIFHGSDYIISRPQKNKGRKDNDYGQGFYTTEDPQKAKEWALFNGAPDVAVCNKYEIDLNGLNVINLDDYGPLTWIAEIISNRGARGEVAQTLGEKIAEKYRVDLSNADVVIGWRADDSYMDVVDAFLKGSISIDEAERMFRKGDLGQQVFIKSETAFERLVFKGYEDVPIDELSNEAEIKARMEVAKFLNNREVQIAMNSFIPYGLTVSEVLNKDYTYDPQSHYYFEEKGADYDD